MTANVLDLYLIMGSVLEAPGIKSFQRLVPGHFAILHAKIGLKMAELDCFQNWLNLDHQTRSKFEGAPRGPRGQIRWSQWS